MGRCKSLGIIFCLILALCNSAESSDVQTITLRPVDASMPTFNDNGDRISGTIKQQAWFAFDLMNIPYNSTVVSATFSAYFYNLSSVPSYRQLWYYSNDSWISIADTSLSDPGDEVVADEMIGTFLHSEKSEDGYVWKTITLTYNGWTSDIADGYFSLMLTGGQYFGSVGQGPTTFGGSWGVDKEPELTLTVISNPQAINVTSPNGDESFQAGTDQSITWYSLATAGANVKIELYKDNVFYSDIISSTANDGLFTWSIPEDLPGSSNYKIKITDTSDPTKYDYSDKFFEIIDLSLPSGTIQFTNSSYSVMENGGTVRVYVSRTGGSSGSANVDFTTVNGSASGSSDYDADYGTLYWSDGDSTEKYFDISINDDNTYEGDETFSLVLSNVSGASLGNPNQTTVVITEDDSSQSEIYPPEVRTLFGFNVTSQNATIVGLLVNDGSPETDENCICRFSYWKNFDQENAKLTEWQNGIKQGKKFNAAITGLDPNTEYLFYAQASNSAGMVEGEVISFKTKPDPNLPPVVFSPNEPNTLLIQNFVDVLSNDPNRPHHNQGYVTYVEGIGIDGLDANDILYSVPASATESKIVSIIPVVKGKVEGFYELHKDVRNTIAQDSLLELSIYNYEPDDPNIDSENYLKFWFAKNAFKRKTVTIQKLSNDPNIVYPVWDVNQIIENNGRKMPLDNLVDQELNSPYAWFTISTSRQILDLNEDGFVNLADFEIVMLDEGKAGVLRSDIASRIDNVLIVGIPDGKVDISDVIGFIKEYNENDPENPIPNPYNTFDEDFESGYIQSPFTTYGNSDWEISSDSSQGNYSAKSGDIDNYQKSILELTVDVESGNISFWRKVSSETEFDLLIFYIDDVEQQRWSGELDWAKMSYYIASGTHTLKWEYIKDYSLSLGEDSAWIDDLVIQ